MFTKGAFSLKLIFVAMILAIAGQIAFLLAQNAGFSLAQTSDTPIAPSSLILNGTPTSASVSLSWIDNAINEDKFTVQRKLASDSWSTFVPDSINSFTIWYANTVSYVDTTVTAGMTYDYRVMACLTGVGCSVDYAYLSVVIPASGSDGTSCTGLDITLNDEKTTYTIGDYVNYTWTCSSSDGFASMVYIWLYKPDGTSVNYNYGSGNTQSMGFSTSNLLPGTHILKACFDSACATVNTSKSFIMSAAAATSTPIPSSTEPAYSPSSSSITTSPSLTPVSSSYPVIKIGLSDSVPGDTVSGTSISGTRKLAASSTLPLTGLFFKFYSISNNSFITTYQPIAASMDGTYKYWSVPFDTTRLLNGDYKITAMGMHNDIYYDYAGGFSFNITNGGTQTPIPSATYYPVVSPKPYITPGTTPPMYTNFPMMSPLGLNPETTMQFPFECREKNIFDPAQCQKIMFQLGMPAECQVAGAKTPEDCSKIIMTQSLPPECRAANATSEADCNKVMFAKYGPKECVEANIYNKDECGIFIFKKNAPPECLSQGITDSQSCEKYMIGKYGNMNNIKAESFPLECQKAGAKTADECDKVMKDRYMPQDCKNQGLTDTKQCDLFMSMKYMPEPCKEAGVKTNSDCDKVMFKKFAPGHCKEAGVEGEKECKDFMYNFYAPKIACNGLNNWDCKQEIKENHLGNIVATQENYKKVKEEIAPLSGGTFSAGDLKDKIKEFEAMISLREKGTLLKVMQVEDRMVLNGTNDLVQTASVALMIDSDGDGLGDDAEKRFGTDPNNSDTDKDGFSDGEEVKKGYNPLGEGNIANGKVAPIDEAILNNRTLSQPKTDGQEMNSFVVEKVDAADGKSATNEIEQNYILSGKAEADTVVTVYIYSDLPLVMTVKTDENGNWKYELSESLNDGEHEVYVALNDNTGKVVNKSKPLSFFVKEAKALSVKDFVSSEIQPSEAKTQEAISNYAIVAVLIAIIGILVFVLFVIQKKRQSVK